jgi:hypothetical protein
MSPDTVKYFEGLLAVYTDNIRISDIKSNIILFFLAISIPTVAAFRTQLPFYMPIFLLLLLPLFSIILLVLAIYPRFVATPGFPFFIKRSVTADDFVSPPDDDGELLALFRTRCARWRKSSIGRFSFSASRWRAASSILRFSFCSRSAGSSFLFQPKTTRDAATRSFCRAGGDRLAPATMRRRS